MKTLVLTLLMSSSVFFAIGQENFFISPEVGIISQFSEMNENEHIRGDIPYAGSYYISSITSLSHKSYLGIKAEMQQSHWAVAGGIRYSNVASTVGKNDYWSESSDYFYWNYKEEEINTEFLKLRQISQISNYIGIPLEIKYFISVPGTFRLYLKLGSEINFLLVNETKISFQNNDMEKYNDDIAKQINDPKSINTTLYGAGGFKYGRDNKVSINLELTAPYLYFASDHSALLNPVAGAGLQLSIQLPLNTPEK